MKKKLEKETLEGGTILSYSKGLQKKHDEIIRSDSDNILVFAGRQTGKDTLIIEDINKNITDGVVIIINATYNQSNHMARLLTLNKYHPDGKFLVKDKVKVLCDYRDNPDYIRDIDDISGLYINELSYVPIRVVFAMEDILDKQRVNRQVRFLGIGTPRAYASFSFINIIKKYDPYIYHMPCTLNEHLSEEYLKEIRQVSNAMIYATEILGLPIGGINPKKENNAEDKDEEDKKKGNN